MKKLVTLMAISAVMAAQADLATLLVDFADQDGGTTNNYVTSVAADFAAVDSDVLGSATVNIIGVNDQIGIGGGGTIGSIGFSGVTVNTTGIQLWRDFNTAGGTYGSTAITGSYMHIGIGTPVTTTVAWTGDNLTVGEAVKLSLWGTGDGPSGTDFVVTYGTQTLNLTTDYSGTPAVAGTVSFTKEAGVNTLDVVWSSNAATTGFNGLALTAVPEPATIGLLAFFGGTLVFIRRKLMI